MPTANTTSHKAGGRRAEARRAYWCANLKISRETIPRIARSECVRRDGGASRGNARVATVNGPAMFKGSPARKLARRVGLIHSERVEVVGSVQEAGDRRFP